MTSGPKKSPSIARLRQRALPPKYEYPHRCKGMREQQWCERPETSPATTLAEYSVPGRA